MKKVFIAFAGVAVFIASIGSITSCSTSKKTSDTTKGVVQQEAERLVIIYLTQRLAANHPTLASVLNTATASTSLSTILANGVNTSTLTNLISSQFGISQTSVASALGRKGGTLGTLAAFIVKNTDTAKLAALIGLK